MESYPVSASIIRQAALKTAGKGRPVFPCKDNKAPCTPRGFKDASTDPGRVTALFTKYRGAKIGMPTGPRSGILVMDVDRLQALEELPGEIPEETLRIRTPSGGLHIYMNHVDGVTNRTGALPDGIDIRGEGGYVIVPPSEGYVIEKRAPVADAPEWLLDIVREPPSPRSGDDRSGTPLTVGLDGPEIIAGGRNQELTRIAGRLHDGSRDLEALAADLKAVNAARCRPTLPDREVECIAASIHRREPCASKVGPSTEVLELVEALNRWWWGETFPKVGGKTMASFLRALMRKGRRIGTVIPGVGLRVPMSVREAAEIVGCHRNTIVNLTKRARKAGILRKDTPESGEGKARAFVLLDPRQACDTQSNLGEVGGVSQACRAPVAELRTSHYRWRGLIGKGKERALCALEAFGPQTREELAERLGWSRPRDLQVRYLEPLAELGLIEERGGLWILSDSSERSAVRDVPYSTVQLRARRLYSSTEGRRVTVVLESGAVASESDREQQDRERHEREREAFHRRHENIPHPHYVNADADGYIEDLQPVESVPGKQRQNFAPVSDLARAIRDYLDRNPADASEPPGWIAVTLWAYELCEGKPSPADVRDALAELGGERYLRSRLCASAGRAAS